MSERLLPPYPSCYWVVPGILLAGAYPGGSDPESTEARLTALLDAGITSVVNLMTEEEASQHDENGEHYLPYEERLEELAEARGHFVEILRYGVEETTTPAPEAMQMILDAIDGEIDGRDSPTFVHCSDGHDRSGAVVGCYLARHDMAVGKDALAKIKELRSADPELAEHRSPANIVGEKFVLRWKADQ